LPSFRQVMGQTEPYKPVEGQRGFDKACPEPVEGLSPNGVAYSGKINNSSLPLVFFTPSRNLEHLTK